MIQINYIEVNFAERNFCSFDSQLSGTDHKTPILVGRVVLGIWVSFAFSGLHQSNDVKGERCAEQKSP